MLTESEQLLIAAAVDGVLTPAEVTALDRLLASKPEAGRLFGQLKAQTARLAALPKRPAPKTLAAGVMARVRPITPARQLVRGRSWLPVAVAASLFVAVTAGSFLFFRGNSPQIDQAQRDRLPPVGQVTVATNVSTDEPVAFVKGGTGEDGLSKPAGDDGAIAKLPPQADAPPVLVVQAAKPRTPEEIELLASALMIESKPLKQIDPALPLLFNALDLNQPDPQARLKNELAYDAGFRLNLFSKNTSAAVEQLQAAGKSLGVSVTVDGNTAERLKKPNALPYAVYVDCLTADELAAFFATLAKQTAEQSRPETVLGTAHFVPADVTEQKDLKELIGLDWPVKPKAADSKGVSDGTLKEVVASVKKSGEKSAVLVTYANRLNAAKSPEVRSYLDRRGERKGGTVPVLIVVRPQ
ncbi:MAG: anti-sigma factor family protein [Armatimonadaceae bacterium]